MTGHPVDGTSVEPASLAVFRQGSALGALHLIAAGEVRNQITRSVGRYFTQYDLLLTPTLPDLPAPLGTLHADVDHLDGLGWVSRVLNHAPFSSLANMSGVPAISLPLTQDVSSGLSIGMRFTGKFGAEDLLLGLAIELENAAPWSGRHPAIWAGSR